jgi:hypothetical protein
MTQCPKCNLWHDENSARRADGLGQGRFCNALWKDEKGLFCSIKVAEGYSGCHCPLEEANAHLTCICRMDCEKEGGYSCPDFEPAKWLREKLGLNY